MLTWLKELDRVLRGEATRLSELRDETIKIPAAGLSVVLVILGMIYGVCMGCFAMINVEEPRLLQLLASTLKVPVLFFLTLVVTFPSLYVFNALVGSRLTVSAMFRLLIAALGVNLAVLAGAGTIVAFFSVCTTSYAFIVLLNVVVFAVSGLLGMTFLLQTLHRLSIAQRTAVLPVPAAPAPVAAEGSQPSASFSSEATEPEDAQPDTSHSEEGREEASPPGHKGVALVEAELVEQPGPLDRTEGHVLGRHVKTVFACWVVLFGLVGAQMGWVLRPFIGAPGTPFEWFRARESNFFEAVLQTLMSLFS